MPPRRLIGVALSLATFLSSGSLAREPNQVWQAGLSLYTSNGDYGTDSETTTTYVPFSLKRFFSRGDLEGVLPIISVKTEGDVLLVGGVPNKNGRPRPASVVRHSETHTGLGDIIFRGRYYVVTETPQVPQIDAYAKIKFPTASRSDGLGTREFDEGGGLEFSKTILEQYLALAELGYTVIGDPPGVELQNQWNFSLGGGYYIVPNKWIGTVTYEERRALVSGDTNPRDLFFFTEYQLTPRWRVNGGLEVGLSSTASDVALLLGTRLAF